MKNWDLEQVQEWLDSSGFHEHKDAFRQHQVTGEMLVQLDYTTLRDIGVQLVGDRARILQTIRKYSIPHPTHSSPYSSATSLLPPSPLLNVQTSARSPSYPRDQFRSMRRSPIKPLVIFPRSSSMKELVAIIAPSLPASSSSTLPLSLLADPPSPVSPRQSEEKDIMNIPSVRDKCARVHGLDNQSHIIRVDGVLDGTQVREKILTKFRLPISVEYQLYIMVAEESKTII